MCNRHGGGIALYISNEFEFLVTMCGPKELEFLLVSLHNINNAHQKVYIGLWYRPPDKNTALDGLYSVIENLDVALLSSFVLLGDFNIDFCKQSHPLFSKLSIFLQSFVLTQVVPQPTHISPSGRASLIDLVLLSSPSQLVSCNVIPPLGNSDHNGINLTIKCFQNTPPVKSRKRTIWRYSHADFDKANRLIKATDWTFLDNETNIDAVWTTWESKFMTIMEECIPRATIFPRCNLPWMSRSIRAKIRKRNSAYKKARETGGTTTWKKYTSLRNQVVHTLRQAKKDHLKKVSSQGSKQFWKTVKFLKKASSQIPTLNNGSIIASTNVDKASVLNEVLSQNFNSTVPPLTEADSQTFSVNSSAELPENIFCSEDEVLGLLLTIDTSKASGPDGISGTMLKNTAHTISPLVTRLFNLSIKTGKVPHQWKISSVVPIPKASPNTDNPRTYRPISLLPVISKLLERHIHSACGVQSSDRK